MRRPSRARTCADARAAPAEHGHRARSRTPPERPRISRGRRRSWHKPCHSSRARTSCTTRRPPTWCRPSCRNRLAKRCWTICDPRLFEPLGIENASLGYQSARRSRLGGYGLSCAHGGHRATRPAVSAERHVERQAAVAGVVGGGGDVARRSPTAITRRAIGTRGTVSSSGDAGTIATGVTVRLASTVS